MLGDQATHLKRRQMAFLDRMVNGYQDQDGRVMKNDLGWSWLGFLADAARLLIALLVGIVGMYLFDNWILDSTAAWCWGGCKFLLYAFLFAVAVVAGLILSGWAEGIWKKP